MLRGSVTVTDGGRPPLVRPLFCCILIHIPVVSFVGLYRGLENGLENAGGDGAVAHWGVGACVALAHPPAVVRSGHPPRSHDKQCLPPQQRPRATPEGEAPRPTGAMTHRGAVRSRWAPLLSLCWLVGVLSRLGAGLGADEGSAEEDCPYGDNVLCEYVRPACRGDIRSAISTALVSGGERDLGEPCLVDLCCFCAGGSSQAGVCRTEEDFGIVLGRLSFNELCRLAPALAPDFAYDNCSGRSSPPPFLSPKRWQNKTTKCLLGKMGAWPLLGTMGAVPKAHALCRVMGTP